jgi:hypothetical protein
MSAWPPHAWALGLWLLAGALAGLGVLLHQRRCHIR